MAQIRLESPYAVWRGKDQTSGGNVLFPVEGRMYARPNTPGANPKSVLQTSIRTTLGAVSASFSGLSAAYRNTWETAAREYTRTDKDGQPYQPGAKALFVSVNWYRSQAGLALAPTAPSLTGPVTMLRAPSVTVSDDTTTFTFDSETADGIVLLEASRALPGKARRAKKGDCRLVDTADSTNNFTAAVAGAMSISVTGAARRHVYDVGDRIGLRATLMSDGFVRQGVQSFEVVVE